MPKTKIFLELYCCKIQSFLHSIPTSFPSISRIVITTTMLTPSKMSHHKPSQILQILLLNLTIKLTHFLNIYSSQNPNFLLNLSLYTSWWYFQAYQLFLTNTLQSYTHFIYKSSNPISPSQHKNCKLICPKYF